MIASLELVSIAFGKLHSGSIDLQPARGTGTRLTGPEAAAHWMGIVKAVDGLVTQPKAWAYYSLVDGMRDKEWEARTVCLNVREALQWTDPKNWADDPAKSDQKKAVLRHIVWAVAAGKPVINQDLATIAGLGASQNFAPSQTWGKYRQAVNTVFDRWDADILEAVSYALDRRAA